jgi:hypothetical protein
MLILVKAEEVRPGDLMECSDGVFRPVKNIERQFGRLYFMTEFQRDTRTCLVDDLVMVGR